MDRRFIATLTITLVAVVMVVVALTFVLVGALPGEARKAFPNPPLLVASPAGPASAPAPSPSDGGLTLGSPSASPASTASPDPAVRPAPIRTSRTETIPAPLEEPEALGGISPAARPATPPFRAGEAGVAPRPARPAAVPAPPRALPERRPDGVLTPVEVRRLKAALRLSPEQERYWPPVEALLQEIGAQQIALIRAGRQPSEALGFGMKMRAYSATRPLLSLLQEEQKAEIRRRARALGFEAVAAAI
jgi:hypothetical protein